MVIAGQPSLSDQVRGLVWEWLIHWPWESTTGEDGLPDGDTLNHGQDYETELKKLTLKTSVFDSNGECRCNRGPMHGDCFNDKEVITMYMYSCMFVALDIFLYKCKARCLPHFQMDSTTGKKIICRIR
jgi:hypothetical protein